MNMPDRPELQKAFLPPHSQASSASTSVPIGTPDRIFEELIMDPSMPFDYYSFMRSGSMTVAMESHADVWDVFPGASVTRYFDGTAELHANTHPVALMHLDSFEITFQSSDPTCLVNETSTTRSPQSNKFIVFEPLEKESNATIARCRFRIVIPETLFPWNGGIAQFRIRVCALLKMHDPQHPGVPILQRGPERVHQFSLQLRTSSRGLSIGP
ncbi:hypothetical protein BDV93DRAFT_564441 [Ceratobasidium sp. AG-I]|nr:hypothetical protein BDV93DRAFT_564441 [Ceratobasidium sp. AG-I]